MSGQLSMFNQTTSEDSPNVISSPESASGATPCALPGGKTPAKPGQARAPVSPSVQPVKAKRSTTKGIFGQSSFVSSRHEDLSFALGSRLRPLTDSLGSTLFSLTWMTRITPAGRSISALRASEPLTEGSVFIGWPTPKAADIKGNHYEPEDDCRRTELRKRVSLAAWPTPMAQTPAQNGYNEAGNSDSSRKTVEMCRWPVTAWATPKASDGEGGRTSTTAGGGNAHLDKQARLSGWTTPRPTDDNMARRSPEVMERERNRPDAGSNLAIEAQSTAFGPGPIGYLLGPNGWEIVPASGQLNAAHSRWLMGLPPVWDDCGVTAMESLSKRRKPSSKATGA